MRYLRAAIRLKQNRRVRARQIQRKEWLAKYKLERGCELCGYNEHAVALEFDHLDPAAKRGSVAWMAAMSWKVLQAEIAKCRILCANCHRIESVRKKQLGSPAHKKDPRQGYLRLGDVVRQ